MANERQAFEAAIALDPLDMDLRKVFSDWLDEHDEPELANFHRTMTVEKYQQAKEWMVGFANEANTYEEDQGGIERTFDECMEAARLYLDDGTLTTVGGGFGFGATNQFVEEGATQQFWRAYSTLTATVLHDDELIEPFTCCT